MSISITYNHQLLQFTHFNKYAGVNVWQITESVQMTPKHLTRYSTGQATGHFKSHRQEMKTLLLLLLQYLVFGGRVFWQHLIFCPLIVFVQDIFDQLVMSGGLTFRCSFQTIWSFQLHGAPSDGPTGLTGGESRTVELTMFFGVSFVELCFKAVTAWFPHFDQFNEGEATFPWSLFIQVW